MTTKTKTLHPYHTVLKWVADGEEIQVCNTEGEYRDVPICGVLSATLNGTIHNDYFQPNEFRIKPHIHQELMDAHKAGASIQFYTHFYKKWRDCGEPAWYEDYVYRIKPQPKPDIIGYCNVDYSESSVCYPINFGNVTVKLLPTDNVKVTFCGETLKLKAIEMIKGDFNDTI